LKLRSFCFAYKLFTIAFLLILINLFYACGGSSEKTDMSNLPDFSNMTKSADISIAEIINLGQIATFGDINNDN